MSDDGSRNGRCDARLHLANGLCQADEDGAADDAVADVELFHPVESRDGPDVLVIEAVAGVQFQPGGDCGGAAAWRASSSRSRSGPAAHWHSGRCAARPPVAPSLTAASTCRGRDR